MTEQTSYLVSETRWLLHGRNRQPPRDVAAALNRKPNTIYKMAVAHGLADVRDAFSPYSKGGIA